MPIMSHDLRGGGLGGGLPPPKISFVALHGQKRTILGGFATLQTSPQQANA